jgi:hypothetical protein
MNTALRAVFSLALLALAACGARTPAPNTPSDAEKNTTETASVTPTDQERAEPSAKASAEGDKKASAEGDKEKAEAKAPPCGGSEINDLLAMISQSACELPDDKRDKTDRDVTEVLEIKVTSNAHHIAPGSKDPITITYHNKGKAELPLDFVVDPEPRFEFELYTRKGARVDKPAGGEPSLPAAIANAATPEKQIARITLAPQGTAKLSLTWDAVKYRWASKEKAKGAASGHGYPREPAGPVPRGKYILRVVTPLVGIHEGSDHEMSQPRIPIDVGM